MSEVQRCPPRNAAAAAGRVTSIGGLASRVGSGITPTGGSDVYVDSGVIFLRSQNVTKAGLRLNDVAYIDDKTHAQMAASAVFPYDVLLNITGASIGRCCYIPGSIGPANVNQHVCTIRLPNPNLRDAQYLAAVLESDIGQRQIFRLNAGGNREGLNYQQLRSFEIPWPSEKRRHSIAEILSTVDEAIEQTEKLIAKTQQVKTGLMHDLFTRGVTSDGKLRPTREEAPELYKETALGWVPRGWGVIETRAKLSVVDPQPDHRTPPEVLDGVPYIGIGDVSVSGKLDLSRARRISPAAFSRQLESFDVFPGAFIFGKIGTIGQPTQIPHERSFAISANVVLLTTKSQEDSLFLFWVYQSSHIEKQIIDATNTTSQPALGIQRIRGFRIPWPELDDERQQFTLILEAIGGGLKTEIQHRNRLRTIKCGIMHDLLTGGVKAPHSSAAQESSK